MRKLVQGIVDFRKSRRPDYAETFARLALRQKPDALYIACSDSRVQANVFASTEPGDLFVVRNPGNLVSPAGLDGKSLADESEAAAIEFALATAEVHAWDPGLGRFRPIDDDHAAQILQRIKR